MTTKTYGQLVYSKEQNVWTITHAQPHVWIKLKSIFLKIPQWATEYAFANTPENCADLHWFMQRYPLALEPAHQALLKKQKQKHEAVVAELEKIFLPQYQPADIQLKEGFAARGYQKLFSEMFLRCQRMLLGDDYGLGKTLQSLLPMMDKRTLPALVVVQTHLAHQWKEDNIEKFTNLRAVILNGRKPYSLPPADVYIIRYSCLAGWVNALLELKLKYVVFDEAQELRRTESDKYRAAAKLSEAAMFCLGVTATPIYNYGEEVFNIMNALKPHCLGAEADFRREWCSGQGKRVTDPVALGTYLRDQHLFLRRTKQEVGLELPQVNTLTYAVGYDQAAVQAEEDLLKSLAMRVVSGLTREERFEASGEFDLRLRQLTGISKAREVAAFVKMVVESGESVLLAGWHRAVYDIWARELEGYNPVWYTGTESAAQKQAAKDAFLKGESKIMIMSIRSGPGLDGLQEVCAFVVVGELDWSPQVHGQFVARVDRPGQTRPVTAVYPVSEYGSDPAMVDVLGLKSSQSHGILNPFEAVPDQHSDESRVKKMAERFLEKRLEAV